MPNKANITPCHSDNLLSFRKFAIKSGFLLQFLLILIFPVLAQESGMFLKLPISVKASGMGDSFAAIADEPFGVYYNPAGIAFISKPAVSFAHHIYLQDISGNSIGFVSTIGNFSISAAPTIFSMKDEPVYDSFGNATGESFGYKGMIIPITTAFLLGNLAMGSSIRFYSETISNLSDRTIIFDAGGIYKAGNLRFGYASINLEGKLFDYDLLKIQRFSAAYLQDDYLLTIDVKKEGKFGNSLNAGAEFRLADAIKLRSGWRFKENFGGLAFGIGLTLGKLDFDWALLNYGGLGDTYKIGISCWFGSEKKKIDEAKFIEEFTFEPNNFNSLIVRTANMINIAVMDFIGNNVSQTNASIVADILRTELARTEVFNVVDKNKMKSMLTEHEFQAGECVEQKCAIEIGKLLNAQQIVIGSLLRVAEKYYISVTLIDVNTGKVIAYHDIEVSSSKKLKQGCRILAQKLSKR